MIGWIAKTYPDVVRKIAEKYQIGCNEPPAGVAAEQGGVPAGCGDRREDARGHHRQEGGVFPCSW